MVTKEVLIQYADTSKEVKEIRKKIDFLETRIPRLEKRIAEIEAGETVKDKVRGGNGGLQSFTIEGVPTKEYTDKKTELSIKRMLLKERKEMLEILELELLRQTNDVEKFIRSVKDSHIRLIIRLRVIEGMAWNEVADEMGGGNTEDSVKKTFYRYVDRNNQSCPTCPEKK